MVFESTPRMDPFRLKTSGTRTNPKRLIPAVLGVFFFRVVYGGLVHGPLFLHRLVYQNHTGLMSTDLNLPGVVLGEGVVSVVLALLYLYHFSTRPNFKEVLRFGCVAGLAIYLPQNLFNWILIENFDQAIFWCWFLAGTVGATLSSVIFWSIYRS